jgi:hypothetical protein
MSVARPKPGFGCLAGGGGVAGAGPGAVPGAGGVPRRPRRREERRVMRRRSGGSGVAGWCDLGGVAGRPRLASAKGHRE